MDIRHDIVLLPDGIALAVLDIQSSVPAGVFARIATELGVERTLQKSFFLFGLRLSISCSLREDGERVEHSSALSEIKRDPAGEAPGGEFSITSFGHIAQCDKHLRRRLQVDPRKRAGDTRRVGLFRIEQVVMAQLGPRAQLSVHQTLPPGGGLHGRGQRAAIRRRIQPANGGEPAVEQRALPKSVVVAIHQPAHRGQIGCVMITIQFGLQQLTGCVVAQRKQHIQGGGQHARDAKAVIDNLVKDQLAGDVGIDDESLTEQEKGAGRLDGVRIQWIRPKDLRIDALAGERPLRQSVLKCGCGKTVEQLIR
ncbi:MAG: hypothetical protein BWY83_03015 [bacterium ADurb.Bin478]|nr:MAG: hypothetical protein BWY83_03015 [bacterium ADurb.Bin478]